MWRYALSIALTCATYGGLSTRDLRAQPSTLIEAPVGPRQSVRGASVVPFARLGVAPRDAGTGFVADTTSAGRRRGPWVTGALIGGLVGAIGGAVAGADFARSTCDRPNCRADSDAGRAAIGGAMIGAAVGTGLGAAIGLLVDRRRSVNGRASLRLRVGPPLSVGGV